MNRLKYGILIIILSILNSCKVFETSNANIEEDFQDELYYEYDNDYYDYEGFDRG